MIDEIANMFSAMQKAEEKKRLQLEQESRLPVILTPEAVGYSRDGENNTIYIIRLTGKGKPPNLKSNLKIEEKLAQHFTIEEQNFEVEYKTQMSNEQFLEAVEWINSQLASKWSVLQKTFLNPGRTMIEKTTTYFSFSTSKDAALFKMFHT
jgi:hypothetical protein